MARIAVDDGVQTMVATPHVNFDYPVDAETVMSRVGELNVALARAGISLAVLPGAEISMARAADLKDEDLSSFALGGGRLPADREPVHQERVVPRGVAVRPAAARLPAVARAPRALPDLPERHRPPAAPGRARRPHVGQRRLARRPVRPPRARVRGRAGARGSRPRHRLGRARPGAAPARSARRARPPPRSICPACWAPPTGTRAPLRRHCWPAGRCRTDPRSRSPSRRPAACSGCSAAAGQLLTSSRPLRHPLALRVRACRATAQFSALHRRLAHRGRAAARSSRTRPRRSWRWRCRVAAVIVLLVFMRPMAGVYIAVLAMPLERIAVPAGAAAELTPAKAMLMLVAAASSSCASSTRAASRAPHRVWLPFFGLLARHGDRDRRSRPSRSPSPSSLLQWSSVPGRRHVHRVRRPDADRADLHVPGDLRRHPRRDRGDDIGRADPRRRRRRGDRPRAGRLRPPRAARVLPRARVPARRDPGGARHATDAPSAVGAVRGSVRRRHRVQPDPRRDDRARASLVLLLFVHARSGAGPSRC